MILFFPLNFYLSSIYQLVLCQFVQYSLSLLVLMMYQRDVVLQDSDVHVTYEDQQKINSFARTNARLQDLKEELDSKKAFVITLSLFAT